MCRSKSKGYGWGRIRLHCLLGLTFIESRIKMQAPQRNMKLVLSVIYIQCHQYMLCIMCSQNTFFIELLLINSNNYIKLIHTKGPSCRRHLLGKYGPNQLSLTSDIKGLTVELLIIVVKAEPLKLSLKKDKPRELRAELCERYLKK